MSRLLLGISRITFKKAIGVSLLGYTSYISYDHLHIGTITRQQQHADIRYSTLHHTSKIDRTYDVLPKLPDQRSIRIIKLHGAADRDDEIHIDLATVSLDRKPSYEALSYTWGAQKADQVIYVSGMKFYITANVQAMMKELRLGPGQSRYLWIDAICINQEDVAEKNSQVAMMAEIYKKATRVNIWLGDSNKSSRFLFWSCRLLLPLAPVLRIERKILYLDCPTDARSKTTASLCVKAYYCFLILLGGLDMFGLLPLQGYRQLFSDVVADLESRPYWERVWTIQESNMNPNCFILCGSSMPLHCQILFRALPILNLLSIETKEQLQDTLSSDVCELHMRRHDSGLHIGSKRDEGNYLLRRLCSKKATNEVDKIFAVRALFPATFGMVNPDYSQTAVKVFTDAARSLLEAHHDVRFMRFASHGGRNDGMPTWVPTWTPTHAHRWIWGIAATRRQLYQPALVAKDVDENVLRIKALRVDRLTATISGFIPKLFPVGKEQDEFDFKDLSTAQAACAVFKAWIEKLSAMSNGATYINRLDSMVDRMSFHYLGWERILRIMKAIEYDTNGDYSIRAQPSEARMVEHYLERLVSEIEDHYFFVTAAEGVGISPIPVREEDEIILLTGETLPYIVRKSPDHPGKFTVVSPCMFTAEMTSEKSKHNIEVETHHPLQEWFWGRPTESMTRSAKCDRWEYIDLV